METTSNQSPVVIVGGGIAGAALATALARAGQQVVVLESTVAFGDRVRGESMMPWGVAEAQALGVADLLHAAGAHTAPLWKRYSQGEAVPRDVPVGRLLPGVAGSLNLHHPVACQALLDAAAKAGATVVRGVRDLAFVPGLHPSLIYRQGGSGHAKTVSLKASLVVGADGRGSVVRRSAGIRLQQQEATVCIAGLLLEGVGGSDQHDSVVEHDMGLCLLLHQGGGRARAYQVVPVEQQARYVGGTACGHFLAEARAPGSPLADALADVRAAGPCGVFPGTDTWTDQPYAQGVVLIGDAAGHNDPAIGCGLSIAMRDARSVRDLVLAGARRPADFAPYGAERFERLRRLRLTGDLTAAATVESGEGRAGRRKRFAQALATMDSEIFPLVMGMFAGPETIPARLVNELVLERIRAA